MSSPRFGVLIFGAFELDLAARELRRSAIRVHLPQQAFRTLALLVSREGAIVTREELRQALWPDGTNVEFERGINFCINQVRNALRDDARAPRFIETVPRVGYRFVAKVHAVASSTEPSPPAPARRRSLGRPLALAAALVLAAVAGAGHRRPPLAPGPTDPAAQDAYLRGTLLMRSGRTAAWEEAERSLEQAVALEPRHAAAQAALADALLLLNGAGLRPANRAMPRARAAALAALREDPGRAEAWLSLATVRLYYDWDWSAARDIERALAIHPESARAHNAHAALLSARGDHARAIEAGERAASLDPLCPLVQGDVGWYYYCARRFSEAADRWRRSVAIVGEEGPLDRLVDAFRQLGRDGDAWREARRTMLHAGAPLAQANALEQQGIPSALSSFLAGSVRYLEGHGASLERLAALHAALGRKDRALELLEQAAQERSRGLLRSLAVDPDFDVLRPDPRYTQLLKRVGLS